MIRGLSILRRFQYKIYQRGDCWEWRGYTAANGYGRFFVPWIRDGGGPVWAHRFAYELAKGKIPDHLQLDHICRHRWCVRPSHLEAVPQRVNQLRGTSPHALNARKTYCLHDHPFDAANTSRTGSGSRRCKACHREAENRRYREGKKVA